MKETFTYEETLTALIVWETMLERFSTLHRSDKPIEAHWAHMAERWDNVGAYAMRYAAMVLAPWVEEIHEALKQVGTNLPDLDLDPFDWSFVPAVLKHVDWTKHYLDPEFPPASELAAKLIAAKALGVKV